MLSEAVEENILNKLTILFIAIILNSLFINELIDM